MKRKILHDGSKIQGLKEREIGGLRKAGSINAFFNHWEIRRRHQNAVALVVSFRYYTHRRFSSRLVSSLLFSSLLVSSSPKTQMEDQRTRIQRTRILERRERGRLGLGSEEEEEKRRRLRRGTSLLGFRFSVGSESVIGK